MPSSPARVAAIHACGLLGVVALSAGIALLHLQRGLFDSEAFATRLSRSLEDPRVSALVADRITDAVLRESPDLTAFRPLVRGAAQGVVSSPAFRAALNTAARTAHAAAFSAGGREMLLSVQDVDVLVRSALAHASPELAAKIPPGVQAAVASVGATQATRVLLQLGQQGRRLAHFAWVMVAGGMLLLLLGILLEADRQRGLLLASYDLAGAGLLLALLLPTPDPKPSNAAIVNAYDFLLARARRCEAERKKLPNVVAVDFYRTGDLQRVVRTLNGL